MNTKKTIALVIISVLSIFFMCWKLKYITANYYNKIACESPNFSEGVRYINKALKLDNNPLFWLNEGVLNSKSDSIYMRRFLDDNIGNVNLDTSCYCFEKAIKLSENEWVFKLNYALSLWLDGHNRNKSIILLRDAIDKHDVGCELIGILGLMEEKVENQDNALGLYSRLLIQYPAVVNSSFFKELKERNVYLSDGALDSAIHYLSDNTKDNPVIMAKLGILFIEKKQYEKAQELLSNAVTIMPTMNRAWYYLGVLAEKDNQIQRSHELYKKSLKLDRFDILAMQKVASFDSKYETDLDLLEKRKKDNLALALSNRFSAVAVNDPFLLIGLTDYFSPKIR